MVVFGWWRCRSGGCLIGGVCFGGIFPWFGKFNVVVSGEGEGGGGFNEVCVFVCVNYVLSNML